ncbi:hypothetical protein [Desertimonas flava]|uniref:hypothetical protein n=1 Tax=Desertimonas flava TaxID=2064846 RepID=UPI000E345E82|nr:hypothetical protein [Desertimonas flava]
MTAPTDREKLAFTFASDSCKQVLTLSTTILSFTIAFRKDIAGDTFPFDELFLWISWLLLALAILAGVAAYLSLTGVVGKADEALDIYSGSVTGKAGIQMGAFALGLVSLAVFGVLALTGPSPAADDPTGSCTIEAPATGTCTLP